MTKQDLIKFDKDELIEIIFSLQDIADCFIEEAKLSLNEICKYEKLCIKLQNEINELRGV